MPRKAPDGKGVIEHRITLGDYERKILTAQLSEDDRLNKARTYTQIGKAVGVTGAIVGGTIVASTLGTLALAAYRESADLVDKAQDMKGTAWTYFKYRIGLASFDDLVDEAQDYLDNEDERKAERERRKQMGILEYGLDRFLVFLLGEDKKWTSQADISAAVQTQQEQEAYEQMTQEERYWASVYEYFGGVDNYNNWRAQLQEWMNAEAQFCNPQSSDYDPEVCREIKADKAAFIARTWPNYPEINGITNKTLLEEQYQT
jgi:hypothetical protein